MLIQRDEEILGWPAVEMRDLMRELDRCRYSTEALAERLGLEDGASLVTKLIDAGYIEDGTHDGGRLMIAASEPPGWEHKPTLWTTTVQGTALAKARIGKPMPRAKADKLLAGLIDRAKAINADPEELYWIDTVELYGSLADPTMDVVGDVDVRVVAMPRHDPEEQKRLEWKAAEDSGHRLQGIVAWLGYVQNQLRNRLKNRSSLIDLQLDIGGPGRLPEGARVEVRYQRTTGPNG